MTNDLPLYAIEPPVRPSLPIVGTAVVFPVNRVFCIGRNYAAHAVEMGHDPDKEAPFFFLKSATCLTSDGVFPYPSMSNDVHFEVEMTVALVEATVPEVVVSVAEVDVTVTLVLVAVAVVSL